MKETYLRQDATGLAALIAAGEISAEAALDTALALVEERNPALNAVVHVRADAARAAIRAGLPQGPFRGVPFLLKDLGAEAVDFPTDNGSRLSAGLRWEYDSEIYLRMRATGLVTFGRSAAPEFGIGPVTEAGVYGAPTRNPWNTGRTPGGSSGGAGAAVAAGIVPIAHGSDGGGSVRIPASSCGLVGFKPTRARLPDGPGAGEGWAGMAIDGSLSRSVRDTAAMLDATQGPDLGAPYWPPPLRGTFLGAMQADPGRLRVRFSTRTWTGAALHPECVAAVAGTARRLADLGHDVAEFVPPETLGVDRMMRAWTGIVACGTALSVRTILKGQPLEPGMADGVTLGAVAHAAGISGADYLQAVGEIHAFGRRMARVFVDCDVLLTPTLAEPPIPVGRMRPDNIDFDAYRNGPGGVFEYSPFTAIFNASGQPAVSLPLHWSADGLPVGVHLAMAFGADERLMSLAAQIERAAPWADRQLGLILAGGVRRAE